jgi:hypothetical protein
MPEDYLIAGVFLPHYESLKKQEPEIISHVMNAFNDNWQEKNKGIRPTFKYNEKRLMIGIYLMKGGEEQLVIDSQGLTREEDAVVRVMYEDLESRLTKLRLPREKWI